MLTSLGQLKPGATYAVQFAGVDQSGEMSEWTNTYTVTVPADAQDPPVNATFVYTSGNITVNWDDPVAGIKPDFAGYFVEVFDGASLKGRYFVNDANAFNYTLALNDAINVSPIPSPTFKITAVDKGGNTSSQLTATASYPTLGAPTPGTHSQIINGINFKWTPPVKGAGNEGDTVSHYEVDVDTVNTGPWFSGDVEAVVYGLNYLYINLPGTTYHAKVHAVDVFGRAGTDSSVMSIATLSDATGGSSDVTAPTLTGSVTVTGGTNVTTADGRSEFRISWPAGADPESGISGYAVKIKRSTDGSTLWTTVIIDSTSHTFRSLAPNTTYNVEVYAINNYGLLSTPALTVNNPTPDMTVTAITSIDTTTWTNPDLTVTWTDGARNSYFAGYDVEFTANAITRTFRTTDKAFVLTAKTWRDNWGSFAPALASNAIRVLAVDTNGKRSTTSPTSPALSYAAPSAIATPSLVISPGSIEVSWSASTHTGLDRYDVIAVQSASGATNPVATNVVASLPAGPTGTIRSSFAAKATAVSNQYKVSVIAYDVFGRPSAISNYQTSGSPAAPVLTTPTTGVNTMKTTWAAVAGAVAYEIQSDTSATPATPVAKTDGTYASWVTTGTSTWNAHGRSFNGIGTASAFSTPVVSVAARDEAALDIDPPTAIGAGTTVSTVLLPDSKFKIVAIVPVGYSEPADFSHYAMNIGTAPLTYTISQTSRYKTIESQPISRPVSATTYYVYVDAVDKSGNLDTRVIGNEDSVSAPLSTVPVPGAISSPITWSSEPLTVSWSAATVSLATDVVGYQIEFSLDGSTNWKTFRTTKTTFTLSPDDILAAWGSYQNVFASGGIRVASVSDTGSLSGYSTYVTGSVTNSWSLVPSAPTLVVGPGWIDVSWSAVAGSLSYELYQGATSTPTVSVFTGTATSARITTSGTTLQYFRLRAKNILGTFSSYGTSASATPALSYLLDNTAPAIPVWSGPPLVAGGVEKGYSSLLATWNKNSESDLAGYKLRYSIDQTNWQYLNVDRTSQKSAIVTESATITGLLPGATYYVGVSAYDLAGNISNYNASSNSAAPTNLTAPANPSNAPTLAVNSMSAIVTADFALAEPDVVGAEVYLMPKAGGPYTKVGTVVRSTTGTETYPLPVLPVSISAITGTGAGSRTATVPSGHGLVNSQTVAIVDTKTTIGGDLDEASVVISGVTATSFIYTSTKSGTYASGGTTYTNSWKAVTKFVNSSKVSSSGYSPESTTQTASLVDAAFIKSATIDTAKIKSLTADKIKSGIISTEILTVGTDSGDAVKIDGSNKQIRSGNYGAGTAGWIIDGDGNAEFNAVDIRNNFEIGPATGARVKMDQNGLAVVDAGNATRVLVDAAGITTYAAGSTAKKTFSVDSVDGKVSLSGNFSIRADGDTITPTLAAWDSTTKTATLTVPTGHGITTGSRFLVDGVYSTTSKAITAGAIAAGVATLTTAVHGFREGDVVKIEGCSVASLNGSHVIWGPPPTTTTFKILVPRYRRAVGSITTGTAISDLFDGSHECSAQTATTISYGKSLGVAVPPATIASFAPSGTPTVKVKRAGVAIESSSVDSQIQMYTSSTEANETPATISGFAGVFMDVVQYSRTTTHVTLTLRSSAVGKFDVEDYVYVSGVTSVNPAVYKLTSVSGSTITFALSGTIVALTATRGTVQNQNAARLQIVSPYGATNQSPAWIALEPGSTEDVLNPGGGSNLLTSVGRSGLSGGYNPAGLIGSVDSTLPSSSRAIINAGEVMWTGGIGKNATFNISSGWAARTGSFGGVYLIQEMDGWWTMQGLLTSTTLKAGASGWAYSLINSIPVYARPDADQIFSVVCNQGEGLLLGRARVGTDGSIQLTLPAWIQGVDDTQTGGPSTVTDFIAGDASNTTTTHAHSPASVGKAGSETHTHTAFKRPGFNSNTDHWVSLCGVRWRNTPTNLLASYLVS